MEKKESRVRSTFLLVFLVKKEKNIKVFNTKGKELAPTSSLVAITLVAREKATWIEEGVSLTLLYTKSDFKKVKKEVIKEEQRVCYICGNKIPEDEYATIDHVNPKSKRGKDDRANLRCCCKRCNDDKKSMDIFQYIKYMKRHLNRYEYIDFKYLENEALKYRGGGKLCI